MEWSSKSSKVTPFNGSSGVSASSTTASSRPAAVVSQPMTAHTNSDSRPSSLPGVRVNNFFAPDQAGNTSVSVGPPPSAPKSNLQLSAASAPHVPGHSTSHAHDSNGLSEETAEGIGVTAGAVGESVEAAVKTRETFEVKPPEETGDGESNGVNAEEHKVLDGLGPEIVKSAGEIIPVIGIGIDLIMGIYSAKGNIKEAKKRYKEFKNTAAIEKAILVASALKTSFSSAKGAVSTISGIAKLAKSEFLHTAIQQAAAPLAVVMGGLEIIHGASAIATVLRSKAEIHKLTESTVPGISNIAKRMESSHVGKMVSGATSILKGMALVAGGAVLIASMATPAGWILLGAAAIIGGIGLVVQYFIKKKAKKEIAINELNIVDEMKVWREKKAYIKENTGHAFFDRNRNEKLTRLGESPLKIKLKKLNLDVDSFYDMYIETSAKVLFNGLQDDVPQVIDVLRLLGIKLDKKKMTIELIANKLRD